MAEITYRLSSTPMFNTPAVIEWAVRGMPKRKAKKFLLQAFPRLSIAAVDKLVNQQYVVKDDVVIVTVG